MTTPNPGNLFPVVTPTGQVWWVVWVVPASGIKGGQRQFHIVQAKVQPVVGSTAFGGIIVQVQGPYDTQAKAQAAVGSSTGSTGTGPGIANPNSQANQPPANPFAGLLEIAHWIGDLVTALTDARMWISLGWLLLGLILVAIAVWILGKNEGVLPDTVPVPVPV
jgi:hypothetical protein